MSIINLFKKIFLFNEKSRSKEPLKKVKTNSAFEITVSSQIARSYEDEIVPASERVKTSFPCRYGLYPYEILVLDYASTFYTDNNKFQGFWWYRYGVENVKEVLNSLFNRGFLKIGDLEAAIEKNTATLLKEELGKRGLKKSGRKAELVNRLLEEVPFKELDRRFNRRTYQLTDLGKKALVEGEYVSYIHRQQFEDLNIWSLNKIMHTPPKISYRDKIWGYLNKRSIEHAAKGDFGLYRNCRHNMYSFLMKENRTDDALAMLAEVVYYDLSGLGNNYNPEYLHITSKYYFPYNKSIVKTAPGIIDAIMKLQDRIGLTEEELKETLFNHMNSLSTPLHLFTPEECVEIIFMEARQDEEALTKIYAKAERRFKKEHKFKY